MDKEQSGLTFLTFPFPPFLLTSIEKSGDTRYFVIDSVEGEEVETDEKGHFIQSFRWNVHKASEEETEKFLRVEEEDSEDGIYTGDIAPGHGGQGYERH